MWVRPGVESRRGHDTRQPILKTAKGSRPGLVPPSGEAKAQKLTGQAPEEAGSPALAWWPQGKGDPWTPLWTACVTPVLSAVHRRSAWLPRNGTPTGKPRAKAVWIPDVGTCYSAIFFFYGAGKRRLIHGMKRNHINRRDGRNLYSARQIGRAQRLQEREAKKGMLNDSCLGCQFKTPSVRSFL